VQALFVPDGDRLVPTELTRGPWRPDAQHGGPPSALLGRAIEAAVDATGREGQIARVGVELVRPVPLVPLRVSARTEAASRRVTHVEAELAADGEVVARSRALVLHVADLEPIQEPGPGDMPGPGAEGPAPGGVFDSDVPVYHRDAIEHRFVSGSFGEAGPAVDWLRLLVPLVAGEDTSGLCRVLALADFGSGISSVFGEGSTIGLINADLTVALHRHPVGEWVRLQAATRLGGAGVGLCTTAVADADGPVGVATQSLLSFQRPG
jgi:hypothetical protein